MKKRINKYKYLLIVLLFLNCAPRSSYKVKSFFFDGVPDPDAETMVVSVIDSSFIKLRDSLLEERKKIYNTAPVLAGSMHEPYKDRKCFECHDDNTRGKAKLPLLELCFKCHEKNTSHKIEHGPVASGNCTQCHSPHKSNFKKLLVTDGQNLCLQCHQEKDIAADVFHKEIQSENCVKCHDPHGGQSTAFLRKDACLQCHSLVVSNKQYLHGPVAAMECNACHDKHGSSEPKLLLARDNQLCFNCHSRTDIFRQSYHNNNKKNNCMNCHDPHGSNQKFLIANLNP